MPQRRGDGGTKLDKWTQWRAAMIHALQELFFSNFLQKVKGNYDTGFGIDLKRFILGFAMTWQVHDAAKLVKCKYFAFMIPDEFQTK